MELRVSSNDTCDGKDRRNPTGDDHGRTGDRTSLLQLWEYGRRHGLSRRRFLRLLGVGGSAAVLNACERGEGPSQASAGTGQASVSPGAERPWIKDPAPFIRQPTNLETRLSSLEGLLTPNELFFVRNHARTPILDASSYRLRIGGDAIPEPLELSLAELREMPSRSMVAYLECAGNWRSFFERSLGQTARGGPWGTGAVGCATWTGVPLRDVLARAGARADAVDVLLTGGDDVEFNRPMPIAKARDPDTILAYQMNGVDLPPDHGYPLRAVVPGWVASNSIKWLTQIEVSTETLWVRTNTSSYVLIGEAWPPERYAPAEGGPVTTQTIKSALALDWPARLTAGRQILRGFAHSPHAVVAKVEWKLDDEEEWRPARLVSPPIEYAWRRFELEWEAVAGSHVIRMRATDMAGNTQPDEVPFNESGYLLNIPLPHPVEVV